MSTRVALLTGGGDRPYALGMATALSAEGVRLDFIGSDELEAPELLQDPRIRFLNLRGNQSSDVNSATKLLRVLRYYLRLLYYALTSEAKIFHILWNNKFQFFDRTFLMLYYKILRKKLPLTVHNVNAGERDNTDSWWNRFSLAIQYRLADHIFVHTDKMKKELVSNFSVPENKVSVIPFGINNTVPNTNLSTRGAKQRLGLDSSDKTILFFGNVAPYKGLEYLVSAFIELSKEEQSYRLLIVGRPKGGEDYWERIRQRIAESGVANRVIQKIEYVPDEETELYFKAADVLILPYSHVFQSGVLFLGYGFGLPAIVTDVGSLREEIIEGITGLVAKAKNPFNLANTIRQYFESSLFRELETRRQKIKEYANEHYSWAKVAGVTTTLYANLLEEKVSPLVLGLPRQGDN